MYISALVVVEFHGTFSDILRFSISKAYKQMDWSKVRNRCYSEIE